jgi:hypothetical protein
MKRLVTGLVVLLLSISVFSGTGLAKKENPEDLKRLEKVSKVFGKAVKDMGIQFDKVTIVFEPSAGVYLFGVENTPQAFDVPFPVRKELSEKTGYDFWDMNYYEPTKTQYFWPIDINTEKSQGN